MTSTQVWKRPESLPKGSGLAANQHAYEMIGQGMNPKDVLIVQPKDWERIQNNYSKYNAEKEKNEAQKRERSALHEKSKDLVQHWENTIEGQRLKKLQARNIREEQEEKERQKLDIEEARLQAEKRKVAIERAKQLQYFETDRVKGFHGALLLTDVLKERDAQIEMKNGKRNWQKEREAYLVEQQRKNYEAAIQAEQEKAKARFDQAFNISQFQKEQVADKEHRLNLEKEDDKAEGKIIKEQFNAFQAAKDAINKRNKENKAALMELYKNDIVVKKEVVKEEQLKQELADAEIKKFVEAKRKMVAMRKKKEQELFEEFQNHTDKMSSKLKAEMQQKVDDEDERIAKAVAQREKKRLEEIERKQQAVKDNLEATKEHRLQMIVDAAKMKETNLLKDKALLAQKLSEAKQFERKLKEDKAMERQKAINLKTFHKDQMIGREKKAQDHKNNEIQSDIQCMDSLVKEEATFQEYADKVIEEAKSNGRNPFPLIKTRMEGPGGGRGPKFEGNAGLRPSYIVADSSGVQLPHHTKDEAAFNKAYGHVGKSANRLGLTWSA